MNSHDLKSIEYIVRGLIRDMPKERPFGSGYHAGVRQIEHAIKILVKGDAATLDNVVHECRKIGIPKAMQLKGKSDEHV